MSEFSLPAGHPPITVENVDDPVAGSGTFRCMVVEGEAGPTGSAVFGVKRPDDEFPFLLITSNGYLCFGDGTVDPYNAGGLFLGDSSSAFYFATPGLLSFTGVDVQFAADNNIILDTLPTSNPNVAGALWNDGGTLKVSAG